MNKLNYVFQSADSFIKTKLIQTYCTSWYGYQTWLLGTSNATTLDVEWRKAIRRTLGLPAMTRSLLLPSLAGSNSFCQQHRSRVTKYLDTLKNCSNNVVNYIYNRAESNTTGPLGKNITYLKVCPLDDRSHHAELISARITHIREIIRVRDGFDHLDVLNNEELNDILD